MAYGAETYKAIMDRILGRIPDSQDKRESSAAFSASASLGLELSIAYTALDFILDAVFGDTAPREYLVKLAAERSITPGHATQATLRAEFDAEVPIGSRYSPEQLNYVVTQRMAEEDTPSALSYAVTCETPGSEGNTLLGRLIPIEHIPGLTSAQLVQLLVPGEDEEETEALRKRYLGSFNAIAFGGNVADYIAKAGAINGVGGVKVYPAWNSGISPQSLVPSQDVADWYAGNPAGLPAAVQAWLAAVYMAASGLLLTVGGTVRLVIIDALYAAPSATLIGQVQTAIDPEGNHGEGVGIAPIGHVVKVDGAGALAVDIAADITYQDGWGWEALRPYAEAAVDAYLLELARQWQDSPGLVVRVSQIETRFLGLAGVLDITGTTINGIAQNLAVGADYIPVRGGLNG